MKKSYCLAMVEGNHIYLDINKKNSNYKEFARVLEKIKINGYFGWYGDIEVNGEEKNGIVITWK